MKRYLGFCALVLCGALAAGALSGCSATEKSGSTTVVRSSDGRPAEVQVKPRTRSKVTDQAGAITVAKAVPTPTPSAKGKKSLAKTPQSRMKDVPVGTSVPFYFSIQDDFWPLGVESVTATIRCVQVTDISWTGSKYNVSTMAPALAVFGDTSTSKNIVLTPGGTTQVNLTFPSSTAGMQVLVGLTGSGENETTEEVFYFNGSDILIVNP